MTSLLQVSWAAAVTLALYAFYCYWEAGRADLTASFRQLVPGHPGAQLPGAGGAGYRVRGRWAAIGALLFALGGLWAIP
jgi:hypothetical protein